MDAIEVLKNRRSCKAYTDEQITEEQLNTILEIGLAAPSAMNRQDTKIIVVRDKKTIDILGKMNASVMGSDKDPFYGATTLTIVFAPRTSGSAVKDGSLIIGAMLYAAYDLEVGASWIDRADEMFENESGKKLLKEWGLDGYTGIGCCIFGKAAKSPAPKEIKTNRIIRI